MARSQELVFAVFPLVERYKLFTKWLLSRPVDEMDQKQSHHYLIRHLSLGERILRISLAVDAISSFS